MKNLSAEKIRELHPKEFEAFAKGLGYEEKPPLPRKEVKRLYDIASSLLDGTCVVPATKRRPFDVEFSAVWEEDWQATPQCIIGIKPGPKATATERILIGYLSDALLGEDSAYCDGLTEELSAAASRAPELVKRNKKIKALRAELDKLSETYEVDYDEIVSW